LKDEAKLVAGAVESRQREFSTGRAVARQLLRQLNVTDFELLRDDDRVPKWPAGIVGSISHTRDLCVVAVADEAVCRGIGVDVEPDEPVGEGIERRVCTPLEIAWLDRGPTADRGQRCRMIFSVKEAVYKAFYPELREFWGFQDVNVNLDLPAQRFTATPPASSGAAQVEGRLLRRAGWIIAGIAIR
jgi:4'-phosphopantetheinyl transferase EntD